MNNHDDRKAQLAHYDAQIQDMKTLRNTLVPVSLLPPEILTAVFICYRDACYDNKSNLQLPINRWMAVGQVCTHWRAVTLNEPQLWSRMSFGAYHDHRYIKMTIDRSKGVPLWIHVPLHVHFNHHQSLLGLLDQFDRFQHLDWILNYERWGKLYLDKMSNVAAPSLKSLRLRLESVGWTATKQSLIPDLFSGGTPSLRHLSLNGFSTRPNPTLMAGLTSFHLQRDHLALNPAGGDLYIFDALQEMTNLREFVFMTSIANSKPNPGRVVNLPHLERLVFQGSLEFLVVFFGRLAVPLSACLKFKCPVYHLDRRIDHQPLFMELASSLASSWLSGAHPHFTDESNPEPSSSSIHCVQATDSTSDEGGMIFDFCAWLEDTDFVYIPDTAMSRPQSKSSKPPNFNISLIGLPPWMLMRCFLASFPLNDLRSIFLDVQLRKKDFALLRRLPFLRSVMVTEQCAADFLNYVINDPVMLRYQSKMRKKKMAEHAPQKIHPPPKYFSKLVYLGFSDVDFGLFDYELDGVEDEAIDMNVFLEFLAFRKHSVPIQKLRLEGCDNVIKGEVELMEEHIGEVIWDELESIKDDFDWKEERGIISDISDSGNTTSEDDDEQEESSNEYEGHFYGDADEYSESDYDEF